MFYCDNCATKNGWPISICKSNGPCESCGNMASCNDRPSSSLPKSEKKNMKTILGTEIPNNIRGIVYLCHYDYEEPKLTVIRELLFECSFEALEAYANIPNPESQLVTGISYDILVMELEKLHKDMTDETWLINLGDTL